MLSLSKQEKSKFDHIDCLMREAASGRDLPIDAKHTVSTMWDMCLEQYNGDQEGGRGPRKGVQYTTINRTQGAVIVNAANITRQDFTAEFSPEDDDDQPVYYVARSLRRAIERGEVNPEAFGLTLEQQKAEEPVAFDQVQMLLEAIYSINPHEKEENIVVAVTDAVVSDALNRVYRKMTANKQRYVKQNILNSLIFGTAFLNMEYNVKKHCFEYHNWPIRNVWIDPSKDGIDESEYIVVEYPISLQKAKLKWPDKKKALDQAASTGTLQSRRDRSGTGGWIEGGRLMARHGSQYENVRFERDMVVVRIAYERGHEFPMRIHEALEEGLVAEKNVVTLNDDGEEISETLFVPLDVDGNQIGTEPITPDDDDWPMIEAVRMTVYLPEVDEELFDGRCPYLDINIGHNKNIDMPNSPYGQGEPFRLQPIQTQINKRATDIATHSEFFRSPSQVMPQSVLDEFEAKDTRPYSGPDSIIGMDDDLYVDVMGSGTRNGFAIQPPTMPGHFVDVLAMFMAESDRISGNLDVLQGQSPGSGTSGRSILALQAEGKAPITYKALNAKAMLKRMACIELDALVRFLPPLKWERILGKFDKGVVSAIVNRIKSIKWDVSVAIPDGSTEDMAKDLALALFERGAMDVETMLEIVRIGDPKKILKRLKRQAEQGIEAGPTPGDLGKFAPPPPTNVGSQDQTGTSGTQAQKNTQTQDAQLTTGEQSV